MNEKIAEAELVLVGIGEEFECLEHIKRIPRYMEIVAELEGLDSYKWMLPYIHFYFLKDNVPSEVKEISNKLRKAYENLKVMLKDKNYFIVSTCMNDLVYDIGFKEEKIVTPCGGFHKIQCMQGCEETWKETPEEIYKHIRDYIHKELPLQEVKMPSCHICGNPMIFNNLYAENYVENGYLVQWDYYGKWLQGTLNRKLCIIELGVGMQFPSVIRWPFEKMAYFNQKSFFYRVHRNLYQLTAELAERGQGISQNAVDFLAGIK